MTIKRIAPYTLGLAAACLLASCDVGPQPVAEETAPLVADAELDRCQQITAEQLQTCLARYPAAAADTCRVFSRDGLEACQISRCRRERETVFSRCLDEARSGRGPGAGAQGILACGQLAQSACTDPARLCFPPPPRPPGASNPPPPPPTPTTPPRPPTPPIPVPPPPPPPRG